MNFIKEQLIRLKDNPKVDYVYSDINCSLALKIKADNSSRYFNDERELEKLLSDLN